MSNNPRKYILSGPAIFANDKSIGMVDSGGVLVSNGLIASVGNIDDIKKENPDTQEIKLGAGLLTPGLVNLHHHLYSTFARGWSPPGSPPKNFKQILEKVWWPLDEALRLDDIYYSALVGLGESLLSGVTSVIDHHSSQNQVHGSLESIERAFAEVGIRGSICFELSDRAGAEMFEAGLAETINALEKYQANSNNDIITPMVGLHASMTLSDRSLEKIAKASASYSPGYHFHLAEDKSDQIDAKEKYNMRAAERFHRFGLLNDKSLAIHGIHLDKNEIDILGSSGTNLVLCPRSNQNNAVGFPEWWNYDNVSIGLGTDGIGPDMIQEVKFGLYASRGVKKDPDFGFMLMGEMLLNKNPEIFENITGTKIGKLAPGYKADMIFWRYNSPTPLTAENIWGHYLYGLCKLKPDTVWVDGKRAVENGKIVSIDFDTVLSESRKLAASLWERI